MSAATIPTPALDKLHSVHEKSQTIGAFLDWLLNEQRFVLAAYDGRHELPVPTMRPITRFLAEYFEIDEEACEAERRAILDAMRTENEARP